MPDGAADEEEGRGAGRLEEKGGCGWEPYGAEALLKVVKRRRGAALARKTEDKLRRKNLDLRVFEEELETATARQGGASTAPRLGSPTAASAGTAQLQSLGLARKLCAIKC